MYNAPRFSLRSPFFGGNLPCSALAAALLLPSPVFAQPTPPPSASAAPTPDAATLSARAKFTEAVPLMKQGRWQEAYPLLLEAWKFKEHWQIALNLARTEVEIGKYLDAVEHLAFVEAATDATASSLKETSDLKERAQPKLGRVYIEASPVGARVFMDGAFIGKVPLIEATAVDPGPHDIEIRVGEQRASKRVEAKSGETVNVVVTLLLSKRDPKPQEASVPVLPTASATAAPGLASAQTAFAVTGITVGLGGAVVGGVLYWAGGMKGYQASGNLAQLEGEPVSPGCKTNACKDIDGLLAEQDAFENAAIGTWVGAGVVATAAAVAFFAWPSVGRTGVTVGPIAAPNTGGILVQGRF